MSFLRALCASVVNLFFGLELPVFPLSLLSWQLPGVAQVLQQKTLPQQPGRVVRYPAQPLLHGLVGFGYGALLGGAGCGLTLGRFDLLLVQQITATGLL